MKHKVLMFGWEFPPYNSGGLGTACLGIVRSMAEAGHKVTFVLPKTLNLKNKDADFLFAGMENVTFDEVPALLYPYITVDSYSKINIEPENQVYGLSLIEEVKLYGKRTGNLVKNKKFDVIHAHDWLSFPAGIEAKKVSGKPFVAHVHATEFDRTGGHSVNREVYKIEKEGMDKADAIVAVSGWTKNILVKNYGIPAEKITVVHNGTEVTKQAKYPAVLEALKKEGAGIVLFVGRITLQKGPDYFIKTAVKVLEHYPNAYFVVAGSGDMERQMMEQSASSGIADRVMFAGFTRGEELSRLYQSADIYVMPSVSEPFGLTPLESLSHQTPVLISKQSGVSEVVKHSLKSDFWDIDDMADKIISVLSHKELAQTLAKHGHDEVQNITWQKAVAGYANVYQNLISKTA